MNFRELPVSVQNIAAQALADKMPCTKGSEPAKALAQNIREAFIELYCLSNKNVPIQTQSGLVEK
ncbi:TPA_asm: formyltetrahydrofolate deformylase [Salmonella enterica subsp. diarizonae]|nr:formyltetrahydrofolate deformylase [Salmonella enterica subsp. diarizonae]ELI2367691.1 formyltetrahydrofolate deformylase [Salmonella enterica]HAB1616827.1 formyltetrahydrofolate deformylase [Salmonella enterica subsp. diarizonae]